VVNLVRLIPFAPLAHDVVCLPLPRTEVSDGHANVAFRGAASTDRCNTGVKSFCRRFEPQRLAGPFVELPCHLVQMSLRVYRQVGALGEVLSEQAIGVLVGAALPRTAWIAEVNINVRRQSELAMIREFLATVDTADLALRAGLGWALDTERLSQLEAITWPAA